MAEDFKSLAKKFRLLAKSEEPKVVAATLTRLAGGAHIAQRVELSKRFTLRNKYTLGSMVFYKASPKPDMAKIDAYTGTKSPYLGVQESGGIETGPDGKETKTTPTLASRGKTWVRPIVARFRWSRIGSSGKGSAFVLGPGTYTAKLSAKRQRRRHLTQKGVFVRVGRRLVKVRIVNKGPVRLPATHWHSATVGRFTTASRFEAVYAQEAGKALARLGATPA